MTRRTKEILTLIFYLSLLLIFIGIVIYAAIPRTIKHIGYLLYPTCWSCTETRWEIDETRVISFEHRDNWEMEEVDDMLVISPLDIWDDDMQILIFPVDLESDENDSLDSLLDDHLDTMFANFQSYEVVAPSRNIDMNGFKGAQALVRLRPHIKVDSSLQPALDAQGTNLVYVMGSDVKLIDYRGEYFVLWSYWRSATPRLNPWGYDQMQMILNSLKFE